MVSQQDLAAITSFALQHRATVVAVAKHQQSTNIFRVLQAGFTHIGENFLEHFQQHSSELVKLDYATSSIIWHYIGKLQSRKISKICSHFNWIQSVENSRQLALIQKHCQQLNKQMECLIQVNISNEPSKSGTKLTELDELANRFNTMDNCNLRGLMMMPKLSDQAMLDQCYVVFANLQRTLNLPTFDTLSVGTSSDWQVALEKGSTMVRLGESLLGPRPSSEY